MKLEIQAKLFFITRNDGGALLGVAVCHVIARSEATWQATSRGGREAIPLAVHQLMTCGAGHP